MQKGYQETFEDNSKENVRSMQTRNTAEVISTQELKELAKKELRMALASSSLLAQQKTSQTFHRKNHCDDRSYPRNVAVSKQAQRTLSHLLMR